MLTKEELHFNPFKPAKQCNQCSRRIKGRIACNKYPEKIPHEVLVNGECDMFLPEEEPTKNHRPD